MAIELTVILGVIAIKSPIEQKGWCIYFLFIYHEYLK